MSGHGKWRRTDGGAIVNLGWCVVFVILLVALVRDVEQDAHIVIDPIESGAAAHNRIDPFETNEQKSPTLAGPAKTPKTVGDPKLAQTIRTPTASQFPTSAASMSGQLVVSPEAIKQGQPVTLIWTTTNANGGISISPSVGSVGSAGILQVFPAKPTTYYLYANGILLAEGRVIVHP